MRGGTTASPFMWGGVMIDTIACMIELPDPLEFDGWDGKKISVRWSDDSIVSARLYYNPQEDDYLPRVTYYPLSHGLRVEFSVSKMIGVSNPMMRDIDVALCEVSAWIYNTFGVDEPIDNWAVQRIDYTWDFAVDSPDAWLFYLRKLSLNHYTTHPQKDGMYWKCGVRWVKFYKKDAHTLRFEVSNFRNAFATLGKWFDCSRTVGEYVHVGRALYVLSRFYHDLGLHVIDTSDTDVLMRLRACFGGDVGNAHYALYVIDAFGTSAYRDMDLISQSQFYRYKKRLREAGFLYYEHEDDDNVDVVSSSLAVLDLPVEQVVDDLRENLKASTTAGAPSLSKNFSKKLLGLSDSAKLPENLEALISVYTI